MERTRLLNACRTIRNELLAERNSDGYWTGRLASSALSTATAVSALSVLRKKINTLVFHGQSVSAYSSAELEKIDTLIKNGTVWIISQQKQDGGWGDTETSPSNPSTTLLAKCAILLSRTVDDAEPAAQDTDVLPRADLYIRDSGGMEAIYKRYGNDRTFSVPILTNAALAGLVSWRDVPPLPFELAGFPQSLFSLLKMPVVSYAIPALVAIGQVIHENNPTKNLFLKWVRGAVRKQTLGKVLQMQPKSGGFLEATPLTAFVVMSLSACDAAIAGVEHPIVRSGVKFLLDSVREDGSWPIDTNLSGWATTLSVNALKDMQDAFSPLTLPWLLSIQHRKRHPFTGAEPGGWAWTDLSGGVPDVDDTSGSLLALKTLLIDDPSRKNQAIPKETLEQVTLGIKWLLSLQNRDGGWPTFCKGWNRFPFDRSGVDLTAHAVRALLAWKILLGNEGRHLIERMNQAMERGAKFLIQSQQKDGSWLPLWFGNQYHDREENPIYGTAKVLLALSELRRAEPNSDRYEEAIIKGIRFAVSNVNDDHGFGCLEETALMTDALIPLRNESVFLDVVPQLDETVTKAIHWLVEQVEKERFSQAAPIGLYFTKLWYHEKLYPVIFTAAALGKAVGENEK